MDTKETVRVKRFRIYYGYYRNGYKNFYPVIRIGGKYLTLLNFEIGDTVEVIFELGKITIAKVDSGDVKIVKPDT